MRLNLMLVTLLVLLAPSTIADDLSGPAAPDTAGAVESCTLEDRLEVDTDAARHGLQTPATIELLVPTSSSPGYCYHDCSPCETSEDCKEPGFLFGFPCTEIPLC